MNALVLPFLSYAVVTTFTPGPNNITASRLGMELGYRRSLPCLAGMASGFLALLSASGLLTDLLLRTWSILSPWVKWIGVAYMLYLGISLFLPHRAGKQGARAEATFLSGLFLQLVNPKGILYCATIYTSFSALIAGSLPTVLISALGLAFLGFSAISLWALTGASLGKALKGGRARLAFNVVMALMLAWCAWSIATH